MCERKLLEQNADVADTIFNFQKKFMEVDQIAQTHLMKVATVCD